MNCKDFDGAQAETNLCGEAGGRAASDGLVADVAYEYRVDRIEKAGLSSSNWSNEQNPNLGHRADHGAVERNTVHQLCSLPDETKSSLKTSLIIISSSIFE